MIRASVSETKNRLSHFIRLVRGGEEVEIMDRGTPVAKIVHISKPSTSEKKASWVTEGVRLGLITPPRNREPLSDLPTRKRLLPEGKGILEALLQEREDGR